MRIGNAEVLPAAELFSALLAWRRQVILCPSRHRTDS